MWKAGRQHSQRSPGRAPIRRSEARAEASSAAALTARRPWAARWNPRWRSRPRCPAADAGTSLAGRLCGAARSGLVRPGGRARTRSSSAASRAAGRRAVQRQDRGPGAVQRGGRERAAAARRLAGQQDRVQGAGGHGRKVNRAGRAPQRAARRWHGDRLAGIGPGGRAGVRRTSSTRRPRASPRSPSTGPRCATRSGRPRCSSCRTRSTRPATTPAIGVIILTGAGDKAFCSGGDQQVRGDDGYVDAHGVGRLNVLDLQVQIRRTPKPVIAMVAGYAIGGGHVLHVVLRPDDRRGQRGLRPDRPEGRVVRRRVRLLAAGAPRWG